MTIRSISRSNLAALACGFMFITLLNPSLGASESADMDVLLLTSFEGDSPDLGWYVQNDNVMGGRSQGGFDTTLGQLVFAGSTNTNGGGFSSIRTQPFKFDLSDYTGIRLNVKADGRRYTWQLQTDARWRGRQVSYWADFETVAGAKSVIDIPFSKFFPQFRGSKLDGPELNTSQIKEFGLYIYDKKDGPFELRLTSVEVYLDNK